MKLDREALLAAEGGAQVAGVLDRAALLACLAAATPLVEGLSDAATQVQPCGIDLTLAALARLVGPGRIGVSNDQRILPALEPIEPRDGWFLLEPGSYMATLSEVVHLPLHLMALARPRSSLLRSGVGVHTAVWDPGYSGRSQVLITVVNPAGFAVAAGARIVQLVVFPLAAAAEQGYHGIYQGENITGQANPAG